MRAVSSGLPEVLVYPCTPQATAWARVPLSVALVRKVGMKPPALSSEDASARALPVPKVMVCEEGGLIQAAVEGELSAGSRPDTDLHFGAPLCKRSEAGSCDAEKSNSEQQTEKRFLGG